MATPPPAEPNEARLVEIARAHVRKFGHARTTVVGVAADAGMTHANVYRYFASKTALLDEVVASGLRPLEARLREAADGADPAHDKLERMLIAVHRDYRDKLDDDPALFDLLIEALAKNRPSARKHRARVQSEIQRVLRGRRRVGRLRHDRPPPRDVADLRRRASLHPPGGAASRPRRRRGRRREPLRGGAGDDAEGAANRARVRPEDGAPRAAALAERGYNLRHASLG